MFIPSNEGKIIYIPITYTSQPVEQLTYNENCSTSPVAQVFGAIGIIIMIGIILWYVIKLIRGNE